MDLSQTYFIGPFHVNPELKQITLEPGHYDLTVPITFGYIDGVTDVTGVTCSDFSPPVIKNNQIIGEPQTIYIWPTSAY